MSALGTGIGRQVVELGHEAPVQPLLPSATSSGRGHVANHGLRPALSSPKPTSASVRALRPEYAQPSPCGGATKVVRQHRALPNRVDAGFRVVYARLRCDVADRKDVRMGGGLQASIDGDETLGIRCETGRGGPARRLYAGGPKHMIRR